MTDKKPTGKVDVYVRVSRVNGREGDSYQSPDEQRERCLSYLKAHGYKAGEVFVDEDESGGKMSRPSFDKAMTRVKSGESSGLIVARLSRFGRNTAGVLRAVQEIEDAGGAFLSIDPPVDTSSATGRFMLTVFAALAEMEREGSREQWAVSQSRAAARGVHVCSRVPYGYRKNENGTLAVDETAAAHVREVFKLRISGQTWAECVSYLNSVGARTPIMGDGNGKSGGGNPWNESTLPNLVRNAIYKGCGVFEKMPEDVRAALKIVSARTWEKANPRTESAARTSAARPGSLLSGLVYCGSCGGRMTPGNDGYRCRQRASRLTTKCSAPVTVTAKILHPHVTAEWLARVESMGLTFEERREVGNVDELREAVLDAQHDRDAFEAEALASDLGPADVARMLGRYSGAIDEAQAALDEALDGADVTERAFSSADYVTEFEKMPLHRQRAGMAEVFSRVIVKRGRSGRVPIAERVSFELREGIPAK